MACSCCKKRAIYGTKATGPIHCKDHRESGEYDISKKLCEIEGCFTRVTHGYETDKIKKYCGTHARTHIDKDKLVDITKLDKQGCSFTRCEVKNANWNYETETKGIYCSKHKLDDMVDLKIKDKLCLECKKKHPCYNLPGETKKLYCAGCAKKINPKMINIKTKRCDYEGGCIKIPSYGYESDKSKLYCKEHKLDDMKDIKSNMCRFEGCNVQATFGPVGARSSSYCVTHKLPDMKDIRSRKSE